MSFAWPDAEVARGAYLSGSPWPHLVLDTVVPLDLVAPAAAEAAGEAPALGRSVTHRMRKSETSQTLGIRARNILHEIEGPAGQDFLRALVGIPDLQCDPSHELGGLHASTTGDFQSLHQDFPRHPHTRLWHRVNVLLYLSDWDPAWGGELLMHDPDGLKPDTLISPQAGRLVIFETHARSEHAVQRMTPPDGVWRLSLASYWYSRQLPPGPSSRPLLRRPRLATDRPGTGIASPSEIFWGSVNRLRPSLRRGR